MTVVDTGPLMALLDASHPRHPDARSSLAEGRFLVTRGSLAELANVVRRLAIRAGRDGSKDGRAAIAAVTGLEGFAEAPQVPLDAVVAVFAADRRLSFVDAWNLVVARQAGLPLLTFDKNLEAAYRKAMGHP